MHTSQNGLEFLKRHEDNRLRLYPDPVGHCTIGFGHLVHRGACLGNSLNGSADYRAAEQQYANGISVQDATDLLRRDVASVEQVINNQVSGRLTQAQFDALVSFTFNVGIGRFSKSNLPELLDAGDLQGAADLMLEFVWAGNERLHGLEIRRRDEVSLFLYGTY